MLGVMGSNPDQRFHISFKRRYCLLSQMQETLVKPLRMDQSMMTNLASTSCHYLMEKSDTVKPNPTSHPTRTNHEGGSSGSNKCTGETKQADSLKRLAMTPTLNCVRSCTCSYVMMHSSHPPTPAPSRCYQRFQQGSSFSLNQQDQKNIHSRTSVARTPLGPWKLVRDRGSLNQ